MRASVTRPFNKRQHENKSNRNVLTIPAELLTAETKTVAIVAFAVPVESDEEAEFTEVTELTEAPTEEPKE